MHRSGGKVGLKDGRHGNSSPSRSRLRSGHREPCLLVLPGGAITTRDNAKLIYASQDRPVSREQFIQHRNALR